MSVNTRHFVIATAGHVDHGKSALVKALTGTDPDRLPEEKAREITIDLGFAHLELPLPGAAMGGQRTLSLSVIDVPGHEDFVRNMIAGLGSIDLALLVVAADDGWMPQTEEHLQILSYLRVPKLVVALNKSDLTSANTAIESIKTELNGTPYSGSPIVTVSARSGHGVDRLKQTLGAELAKAPAQTDSGKARLFIDRGFTLPGIGPVVTGTLAGGSIATNDTVYLQPGNFATRVRSVQTQHSQIDAAHPGMRAGVNLADIPKATIEPGDLRGNTLTTESFESSTLINVQVERSERATSARPLKSGTNLYVHHGSDRIPAVLILASEPALPAGNAVIGQLRLSRSILAFAGDRFILRDRSEQQTLAGGIILETNVATSSRISQVHMKSLVARATDPDNAVVYVETELILHGPNRLPTLLRNSRFTPDQISTAANTLQKAGRIIIAEDVVAESRCWQELRQRAANLIDRAHSSNPAQKGLELTAIRSELDRVKPEVVDALIHDLCVNGFVQRGSMIARATHRPALPPDLESAAKQILALLTEKLLDPPARGQITPDANRRQAARFLIENGDVVEIGSDLLLSREGFDQGKRIIKSCLQAKQSATVSELRKALGTSRRVAIPFLERLDRDRVTQRVGDRRVLSQS